MMMAGSNNLFLDLTAAEYVKQLIPRKNAEGVPGVRGPDGTLRGVLYLSMADEEITHAIEQAGQIKELAYFGEQDVAIAGTTIECGAVVIGSYGSRL